MTTTVIHGVELSRFQIRTTAVGMMREGVHADEIARQLHITVEDLTQWRHYDIDLPALAVNPPVEPAPTTAEIYQMRAAAKLASTDAGNRLDVCQRELQRVSQFGSDTAQQRAGAAVDAAYAAVRVARAALFRLDRQIRELA